MAKLLKMLLRRLLGMLGVLILFPLLLGLLTGTACAVTAEEILKTTGVQGGFIVHLGCGDGTLTAALRANDGCIVHGLEPNLDNVDKARAHIRSLGLYGPVSVEHWERKRLPYIDNFVTLVVAEEPGEIPMGEILRVLRPNGVAYVRRDGTWTKTAKPRPKEIDEWTHWRYDAGGNPVAHDTVVGPPRRLQWVGSPRWARHHDHMASLSALVSSQGRIFYIMDEGPKASIQLPPRWFLTARDAFNGTVLWKRPIDKWFNHLYPLKSGPSQLPRRLVAIGDRVYVTMGINAPVSELDAATGKTLRTYEGTAAAEEILYSDGLLLLRVDPKRKPDDYRQEDAHCWTERNRASKRWGWTDSPSTLMAVDPATGACRWKHEGKIAPLTLAAADARVVFHDGESMVCLDQKSGKQLWRSESLFPTKLVPTGWSPAVVFRDGVILYCGKKRQLAALSADDGTALWTCKLHPSGHFCPEDIFAIDGLVWSGDIASSWKRSKGIFTGRDLRTGEIKSEFAPDTDPHAIMHQRCYPSKATDRYLLTSWIGTEFINPKTKHWEIHHWVRGGCIYGVMPCNGLLYATPHACACYYQSKLCGFNALAPAPAEPEIVRKTSQVDRLERGPAYDADFGTTDAARRDGDWPTYRHDNGRSGRSPTAVPTELKPTWRTKIGGRLSSITAANGVLYVASIDTHTLHALDAETGKERWEYTTGGRIDSPPTIYQGRVLFGSADGWLYCLRAADGELAWRFRVAPEDRRHMAYEQIESVWPVHGSVLVQNDVVYGLAGRSVFLDGGLRLVRLDPKTGKLLSETVLNDKNPETGENLQTLIKQKKMPVALPDVLSSDGQFVYMRSQRFTLDGKRAVIAPESQTDQDGNQHLFCPIGMLDDTWFHRGYWIYGKNAGEGWGEWYIPGRLVPTGRILVFDDESVYGYNRDPQYLCNSSVLEYRLFAAGKHVVPERAARLKRAKQDTVNWRTRVEQLQPEQLTATNYKWLVKHPPLVPRAMALADKTIFTAGPPDVVDEKAIWGNTLQAEVQAKLAAQRRALEGEQGLLLWAVAAKNGAKLSERKLDVLPVFDGLIAANGRLYMATTDGQVICLAGKP